jgi:hypothetical protein
MRNAYTVLVRKPERKRPYLKMEWKNNIKLILKERDLRVWNGFVWLRIEASP